MKLFQEGLTEEFVAAVQRISDAGVREVTTSLPLADGLTQLMSGKMLRTRLAARMVACGAGGADRRTLERSCAAIEIVHTASLCHDDVIDNGLLRRARPALWKLTGPSAAILLGDLLLCKAIDLLASTDSGRYVRAFVSKVREVCAAEAEQEISLRGKRLTRSTCLRLARGKTGPLFAFAGLVSGGTDADLSAALEEAGYRIGTAYQVFDDLVDIVGDEEEAKKTLGTDAARRKFTLPQGGGHGSAEFAEVDATSLNYDRDPALTRGPAVLTGGAVSKIAVLRARSAEPCPSFGKTLDCVEELCRSAVECVAGWPRARAGIEMYLDRDLRPVLDRHLGRHGVCVKLAI